MSEKKEFVAYIENYWLRNFQKGGSAYVTKEPGGHRTHRLRITVEPLEEEKPDRRWRLFSEEKPDGSTPLVYITDEEGKVKLIGCNSQLLEVAMAWMPHVIPCPSPYKPEDKPEQSPAERLEEFAEKEGWHTFEHHFNGSYEFIKFRMDPKPAPEKVTLTFTEDDFRDAWAQNASYQGMLKQLSKQNEKGR